MRDDLLDAQASVDWAVAKLPAFAEEIEIWLRENVDCHIEQLEPPIPYSPIIAKLKAPLPLAFNVEAGAYINAIRSSLDILASTLAVRYSVPKPENAYFPMAAGAAEFAAGNYKGSKFIKGLPNAQRAIIETLKPYQGGNDPLFALHQLDIIRKHKRLLGANIIPGYKISIVPGQGDLRPLGLFYVGDKPAGLRTRDFILCGGGPLSVDHVPIFGFARNGAPDYDIQFTPEVTLNELSTAKPPEVISALHEFASLAHSIIGLFN